jgi:superfamily II DNA/RNA helicase
VGVEVEPTDEEWELRKQALAAENKAALHAWEDSGPHGTHQVFLAPLVGRIKEEMKQQERELQFEALVMVATTQMMEEGISCKKLDTLIDTDNTRDPEQVVGRILRTCPGKRTPVVVDFWIDMLKSSFYQRLRHYNEEGFTRYRVQASSVETLPGPEYWAQFDRPAPLVM